MKLFWADQVAPGRLAVATRPRGDGALFIDLAMARSEGVDVLVSMLTPIEAGALGLAEEGRTAGSLGMQFVSVPVEDHSVPTEFPPVLAAARAAADQIASGRAVAVHCYAGLGRSPLFAASVLVLLGKPLEQAWALLSAARGFRVPETAAQRAWVDAFAAACQPS